MPKQKCKVLENFTKQKLSSDLSRLQLVCSWDCLRRKNIIGFHVSWEFRENQSGLFFPVHEKFIVHFWMLGKSIRWTLENMNELAKLLNPVKRTSWQEKILVELTFIGYNEKNEKQQHGQRKSREREKFVNEKKIVKKFIVSSTLPLA